MTKNILRLFILGCEISFVATLMTGGSVSCGGGTQPTITHDGPATGAVSGNDSGSPSGEPTSTGGTIGAIGTGGTTASGGASGLTGSGGSVGSGGRAGSGGIIGTGGATSSGGSSGGTTGTGGVTATGGTTSTGGASGLGGGTGGGSGGTTASGGTSGLSGSGGSVGSLISTTRLNTSVIGTNRITMTTLTPSGSTRTLAAYVPSTRPTQPSLVIAFHGTNDLPDNFITYIHLTNLSQTEGFIIMAPQARDDLQGNPLNRDHYSGDEYGRWWQTYATDGSGNPVAGIPSPSNNPDLLFVQSIIQEAQLAYNIDPHRVYVMGHSAGAFFTYLTAMALRDQIAAFAENAGGLINCTNRSSCTFHSSFAADTPTTCAALSGLSGYCSCSNSDWPIAVPTSGYVPPGYLAHGTSDDIVSPYYTCQLESRLQSRTTTSSYILQNFAHDPLPGFTTNAWDFMSGHTHP